MFQVSSHLTSSYRNLPAFTKQIGKWRHLGLAKKGIGRQRSSSSYHNHKCHLSRVLHNKKNETVSYRVRLSSMPGQTQGPQGIALRRLWILPARHFSIRHITAPFVNSKFNETKFNQDHFMLTTVTVLRLPRHTAIGCNLCVCHRSVASKTEQWVNEILPRCSRAIRIVYHVFKKKKSATLQTQCVSRIFQMQLHVGMKNK